MKIILLILIIILSGCKSEEQITDKIRKNPMENNFFNHQRIKITETVIGEASTRIIDNGRSRVENIKIACEKISGTKLNPDETFSFNLVTGRKNKANGYKNAPVLVNGESSTGIGGGVCQVSTTIFLAAKNGGLKIAEHHNHSKSVNYAPKGMDATVVYGVKDLKIKNNTNKVLYIYTWVENEKVFAKIIEKSIDIE